MQRRVPDKSCVKCGITGIPFYARMKRGKLSISGTCIICHREDEGARNRRLYNKNKDAYYKRSRAYKMKNKNKINKQARINYMRKVRQSWQIV